MTFGNTILEQCAVLGAISEDPQVLTRTYLTPAHRRAADVIAGWMRGAGMDAHVDALGNVVGRYAGATPNAPVLITGSHMDSVVDAGRYDGLFGVLSGIAAVGELNRRGVRRPFAIEVVAFADEEGVRFGFSMIGSKALAGAFDTGWLARRDAAGVTLASALATFGGDADAIPDLARDPRRVLAFVESHIEQGPVLLDGGHALGVVTAIAGASRVRVTVNGLAGHAGTTPMPGRKDALAAAAAMILAIEAHASERAATLVATVGKLAVAGGGAINVIPGAVEFTIDVRSGDDATRHAAVIALRERCEAIAATRGVTLGWDVVFELAAAPCDPRLQDAFARAIAAQGLAPVRLPSGAGHDAMEMARLAPIGMLFVRCGNGGISHNPLETMTADDADVATRALVSFLEHLDPATLRH
ncbi:MAG: allantoate amidohydrolase [Proteobacteria bacterium]|nr:allantoate amidohydrolase [Pseudomonadota bacterium]